MSPAPTTVAFTIDLEPDCPPFLRGYRGIEHGLPALLDVLRQLEVPATFFTTGEVAERFPRAVEQVVEQGHELGVSRNVAYGIHSLDRDAARDEITQSTAILREFSSVTSFRAPYLQFPDAYLDLLEASGFELDSSQALYKAAYYRSRARTRNSPSAGVGDVVGVAVADDRATRVPRCAVEPRRSVRAPVGVRRPAARKASIGLSIQDRRHRARLRSRCSRVVREPRRAVRAHARAGMKEWPAVPPECGALRASRR